MEYNREFTDLSKQSVAYFIGLFMADGNINKNTATISLIDKDIIDKIHIKFPFLNKGEFDYSKYNINSKVQYYLRKKSKLLVDDLIMNNIHFNKSTINKELLDIPDMPELAISHFIRGYFDGNGSIYTPSNRPNLRSMGIYSTSNTLINSIKKELLKNGIICPIHRQRPTKNEVVNCLEWHKTEHILILKEYLYRNANIYLDRKKELFDNFVPVIRGEDNPICNCGGTKMKNGIRKTNKGISQRYKCDKCKQSTTSLVPVKLDELLETP